MNTETQKRQGRDLKLVTALDVGTSMVRCLIASVDDAGHIKVIGTGNYVSAGVEKGAVVDLAAAEHSIRAAVDRAVKMAGVNIDSVIVNLSASSQKSNIKEISVNIAGQAVEQSDVNRALKEVARDVDPGDQLIVHAFPACYSLDEAVGVADPVGMYADNLSVALNLITAGSGPIRNLESSVGRAHLGVSRMVSSAYASGYATLVGDEMDLGAAVIDMGAGSTNIGVFAKGALVYCAAVPIGGADLTRIIARDLLTPLEDAERIKALYGSVATARPNVQDVINIPTLGESTAAQAGHQQVTRLQIAQAIEPKLIELFAAVNDKLNESGFGHVMGKRVVLTGGASQLSGVQELAQRHLNKQVRIGRPTRLKGLPEKAYGEDYATCVGLLLYALRAPMELGEQNARSKGSHHKEGGGFFSSISNWLRERF